MKNLKESLLNRRKTSEIGKELREQAIAEFLSKSYNLRRERFELIEKGDTIIVNVKGDVFYCQDPSSALSYGKISSHVPLLSITNGMFKFGRVTGDFIIVDNIDLTSLEGAPEKVDGDFKCVGCNSLKTLEGAPKYVGGGFICCFCRYLESLKGSPKYVGGEFNCSYCTRLKSLEGGPEKFCPAFNCSYCVSLTTLKGAPKSVSGNFNCDYCDNLISLEGAPKSISGDFNCRGCEKIKNLKGCPEKVGGEFDCGNCKKLESLEGDLKSVKKMTVTYAQIRNLVGLPWNCREILLLDCYHLTSLKGASDKTFVEYGGCPIGYFGWVKNYKKRF